VQAIEPTRPEENDVEALAQIRSCLVLYGSLGSCSRTAMTAVPVRDRSATTFGRGESEVVVNQVRSGSRSFWGHRARRASRQV